MDSYLARQPIFDRQKRLYGYEILYREGMDNAFPNPTDGELATNTVLRHALFNIGLETIVGTKKALINFTENHLLEQTPTQLPQEICVVEVLEDVAATKEVITACKILKTAGYTLALDDFVFDQNLEPLIALADIIKIDFREVPLEQIKAEIEQIKSIHQIKLLAEKIETYDEFKQAKEMGFSYFQGYFFSRPEVLKKKVIDSSRLLLMNLLAEVSKPAFNLTQIEKLITPDVSLSYKLLRYINSAFYAKTNQVTSIKHALVYLGESGVRQFVCLAATSELSLEKPSELMRLSMVRAQHCKLLGLKGSILADESHFFLMGLFSLLDAMLDVSMDDVLTQLPLIQDLHDGLCTKTGQLAPYLVAVIAYEQSDLKTCARNLEKLGISSDDMISTYFEALKWVQELEKEAS